MSLFFRSIAASGLGALLLLSACKTPSSPPAATAAAAAPAPVPLPALSYAGSQQAVEALDREIAAAGHDATKLNAIGARLVALLRAPDTTFAARQAICQRLSELPLAALTTADARAAFAAMLADEKQLNLARLAIERVPGEALDALFLDALAKSSPATRLALVQSVGNRHLAAAVAPLTPLLRDSDPALAAAAAKALSLIPTPDALAALAAAPDVNAPVIVEARLTLAHTLGGTAAAPVFQSIVSAAGAPAHLRAAAFRGLLTAEPEAATARLLTALSGDDLVLKPVVIEAIATLPTNGLASALSDKLASFDAPAQAAVIAALGRRGDVAAVPAVRAATSHVDANVRTAAIEALGRLPGDADTALLLARIAAGTDADDAKLARQSLARLNGPGVAPAILAGAQQADPAVRAALLDAFAPRGMTDSVPLLLATRNAPDAAVRAAALGSLAELAPASAQAAVLDWATAATDSAEQARALRALASITLRNPDVAARAHPITDAIEHASPAVALRLLPVLPRIGGQASAESAAQLALGTDTAVATAAVTTLARWNDDAGLAPLVSVVEKSSSDTLRASAREAALRFIERTRDLPTATLTDVVKRLLARTDDPAARVRLVRFLSRASDDTALALAEKLKSEPALAADATDAILIIRANKAGRPTPRTSSGDWALNNFLDNKPKTAWVVSVKTPQFLEVDYHLSRPVHRVTLDQTGHVDDFPASYAVFVTDDAANPGAPCATGAGTPGKTVIDLPAGTHGRYLIVRSTTLSEDAYWAVTELLVD